MAVEFQCACGKTLSVPDAAAGRKAKCPSCGTVVNVPGVAPPPPSEEEASTSKVDRMVDKLGEDLAQSRERAPQLTQIAVGVAVLAGATLLLTFFISLNEIVVWILVWLPVSVAGGLIALAMVKADPRTPKLVSFAAPIVIGVNWITLWTATVPPMDPGKLFVLIVTLANVMGYGFLYWYLSRHDTLLLFPPETEDAELVEDASPSTEGPEAQ